MDLFSENGFRGTSITQIETAAGLTPGAGGIYHHFKTKDALLEAGLARHLDRVAALRDIRRIMVDLGDLRAELTLVARYILTELDNEKALLRIIATESRSKPHLVEGAVDQLVRRSYSGFADWLREEANLSSARAANVTAVGLGALLSSRLVPSLFGVSPTDVSDTDFVKTWVGMMMSAITDN